MSLGVLAFHVASIPGNYSSFADEGKTKLESLNWELIKDGKSIFTIPRGMMCRLLMINHWYQHRGSW
jgi:hypothetical protein